MHIDWWTLGIQAINLLILVWILARFFYRPVAEIIEKRRMAATKQLEEATKARAAVEAREVAIQATRAGFAAEREGLLANARRQSESERDELLKQANAAIAKRRADNETLLMQAKREMEQEVVERASAIAVTIAQKMLEKVPPTGSAGPFLNALLERLPSMSARSRQLLIEAAGSRGLDLVTSAPLDETQRASCQGAIEQSLGVRAKLAFRSDPSLIAGVELRCDELIIKNNWRDDLSQILEQIRSHGGQRQVS